MAIKIMLDAGHGGYDNGSSFENRIEKNDNLALTLAVGDALSTLGYNVEYTRTMDVYDSPAQKARIANNSGADYFVSIHRNAASYPNQYNGVQTLVYNRSGLKNTMAKNINSELEKLGFKNINVEARPDLAVLRRTTMPALLVEAGFIDSDIDNEIWDEQFDNIALAIANGIDGTLKNEEAATSYKSLDSHNQAVKVYEILTGIYKIYNHAKLQKENLEKDNLNKHGLKVYILEDDGLYQVRVGEFQNIKEAMECQNELREKGYDTMIVWKA